MNFFFLFFSFFRLNFFSIFIIHLLSGDFLPILSVVHGVCVLFLYPVIFGIYLQRSLASFNVLFRDTQSFCVR